MLKGENMEPQIDIGIWFELQQKELESVNKSIDSENKNRGKRELILVITCLVALLYTYPIQGFENNPNIEIPSVSLKIPLKDAIAVFPTLIASIYLVYLSSAISQGVLMSQKRRYSMQLREFQNTGKIPERASDRVLFASTMRYLFLPSPLHRKGFSFGAAEISRAIVDGFVGLVFNIFPFATEVYIVMKSWQLLHIKLILFWNLVCITMMGLAFASALLGTWMLRDPRFSER
jgi:hypothetical protein